MIGFWLLGASLMLLVFSYLLCLYWNDQDFRDRLRFLASMLIPIMGVLFILAVEADISIAKKCMILERQEKSISINRVVLEEKEVEIPFECELGERDPEYIYIYLVDFLKAVDADITMTEDTLIAEKDHWRIELKWWWHNIYGKRYDVDITTLGRSYDPPVFWGGGDIRIPIAYIEKVDYELLFERNTVRIIKTE